MRFRIGEIMNWNIELIVMDRKHPFVRNVLTKDTKQPRLSSFRQISITHESLPSLQGLQVEGVSYVVDSLNEERKVIDLYRVERRISFRWIENSTSGYRKNLLKVCSVKISLWTVIVWYCQVIVEEIQHWSFVQIIHKCGFQQKHVF